MRLKQSQIGPLARHIIQSLKEAKVAAFQESEEILEGLITDIFKKNFEEEEKLNLDAQRLLDQNKKKIGQNIDEERAFALIKRQLAKERNFVL